MRYDVAKVSEAQFERLGRKNDEPNRKRGISRYRSTKELLFDNIKDNEDRVGREIEEQPWVLG